MTLEAIDTAELLESAAVRHTVRREKKPSIVSSEYAGAFSSYRQRATTAPLLLVGDALQVLRAMPSESIDCAMTSPPRTFSVADWRRL